jgi:hypothetical protein
LAKGATLPDRGMVGGQRLVRLLVFHKLLRGSPDRSVGTFLHTGEIVKGEDGTAAGGRWTGRAALPPLSLDPGRR